MKDFRIEIISLDKRSDFRFTVWSSGDDKNEVIREVDEFHRPFGFKVDRENVTEMKR